MKIEQELEEIILYAKKYYSRGWLYATSGNFSIFDPESGLVWITASGLDKSSLTKDDFISVDIKAGNVVGETYKRPSAEFFIHQIIYKNFLQANACLHVHTVSSCVLEYGLNRTNPIKKIPLPNLEIIKAFGNFQEEPNLSMLVVYNHGHVPKIAEDLDLYLQNDSLDVPFFLIENHGITVWGKSVKEANKNLEAVEFILEVMVARKT